VQEFLTTTCKALLGARRNMWPRIRQYFDFTARSKLMGGRGACLGVNGEVLAKVKVQAGKTDAT